MDSIACKNCGGQMEILNRNKYSQSLGFFFVILGILSVFFIFGIPLAILFLGMGIYMCNSKESVWLCNSCRTAIPRCAT